VIRSRVLLKLSESESRETWTGDRLESTAGLECYLLSKIDSGVQVEAIGHTSSSSVGLY